VNDDYEAASILDETILSRGIQNEPGTLFRLQQLISRSIALIRWLSHDSLEYVEEAFLLAAAESEIAPAGQTEQKQVGDQADNRTSWLVETSEAEFASIRHIQHPTIDAIDMRFDSNRLLTNKTWRKAKRNE
jgi:hypothetical protein